MVGLYSSLFRPDSKQIYKKKIHMSLESCCGRPKMRNSVLEGLRDRKLEDIQLDTLYSYSVFKVSDITKEIQS